MKQTFFSLIVVITVFITLPSNLTAQSPIIGYDQVAWGTSIEDAKQFYSTMNEIKNYQTNQGVQTFEQKNVSNSIDKRTFYFFQNELYKVVVNYKYVSVSVSDLVAKIASIYGKFDREPPKETPSYSYNNDIATTSYYIRNYNRNLTITVEHYQYPLKSEYCTISKKMVITPSRSSLTVTYEDEPFQKYVEEQMKNARVNKIDL